MQLVIQCVPASDGVAVHPCGTVDSVGYRPAMLDVAGTTLDPATIGEIFAWSFSGVLLCWIVGLTIGAIVRVVRAA